MRVLAGVVVASMLAANAWAQDALAGLAGEISAVLQVSTSPRLLIIETADGVASSRLLAVGDEYRDGWRITAITAQSVALGKGAAEEDVPLPRRLRAQLEAPPVPAPVGATATSNARLDQGPSRSAPGAAGFAAPVPGMPPPGQRAMNADGNVEALRQLAREGGGPPNMAAYFDRFGDRPEYVYSLGESPEGDVLLRFPKNGPPEVAVTREGRIIPPPG